MGHHYLPQFYLQGFCHDTKLWAHDKKVQRSFRTQPKVVANETEMYTSELEQHLANEVEGPALGAIDRIRKHIPLREDDRAPLAAYIVALWKRVPAARTRVAGHVPGLAEAIKTQVHQRLDAIAIADPSLAAKALTQKSVVNEVIARYKAEPPDYFWHHTVQAGSTPRVLESLMSMNWNFLVSRGPQLITCDNPVFFFESEGIGRKQSELTLPLSSDVALWANRKPHSKPLYSDMNDSTVVKLNRRCANNARRFLYSQTESPWILKFADRRHTLHRL